MNDKEAIQTNNFAYIEEKLNKGHDANEIVNTTDGSMVMLAIDDKNMPMLELITNHKYFNYSRRIIPAIRHCLKEDNIIFLNTLLKNHPQYVLEFKNMSIEDFANKLIMQEHYNRGICEDKMYKIYTENSPGSFFPSITLIYYNNRSVTLFDRPKTSKTHPVDLLNFIKILDVQGLTSFEGWPKEAHQNLKDITQYNTTIVNFENHHTTVALYQFIVKSKSRLIFPVLTLAIWYSDTYVVKELLRHGASMNELDYFDFSTPLSNAKKSNAKIYSFMTTQSIEKYDEANARKKPALTLQL